MGQFPRACLERPVSDRSADISEPIRYSFIHTGHGDISSQNTWGDPGLIDEYVDAKMLMSFKH